MRSVEVCLVGRAFQRKSPSEQGFSLIELIVALAITVVLVVIAVPGLLRARMAGNEASAIASLKLTSSSQVTYAASCGKGGFAGRYTVLGTPPSAGASEFISRDLGQSDTPQKSGYAFTITADSASTAGPVDCTGTTTVTRWYASAVPLSFGVTGNRTFAVNTNNSIWQSTTAAAPTSPFAASATVSPVQ